MLIPTSVEHKKISGLIPEFLSIAGWPTWKRRVESLRQQVRKNPFLEAHFNDRFALEFELSLLLERKRKTGRFGLNFQDPMQHRLASFVSAVVGVHKHLSHHAQNRLRGMILDGLKSERGLASLGTELTMAVHLMTKGFDVFFNDLETGGGFDLLAKRNGVEIEVECKNVSGDIGRKIHKQRMYDLAQRFIPALKEKLEKQPDGWLVTITIPDRLTAAKRQQEAIARIVEHTLRSNKPSAENPECSIQVQRFSMADSPFRATSTYKISEPEVMEFVESRLGVSNKNQCWLLQPGKSAAAIIVQSARSDSVLDGIYRQLKDAARDQLTGNRPGLLCVHLQDVSASDLIDLAREGADELTTATGIQKMAATVLAKRAHVHTVAFTTPSYIRFTEEFAVDRVNKSSQAEGAVYFFPNPNHPMADDPRYNIFR